LGFPTGCYLQAIIKEVNMLAILVAGEDTFGGVMYTHPEYELVVMATVMQVTSSVCLTLVLQW
jgi:hypothetical protein